MNIVYADVDGNVGYAMSGRLPVRASGDGTLPLDGNAAPAWSGTIEPGSLPRLFNPPSGLIYSANNEIDRSFSGLITRDWTARIPRLAPARRAAEGRGRRPRRDGGPAERQAQRRGRPRAGRRRVRAQDRPLADGEASTASLLDRLAKWDHVVDSRPVVSLYEAFEDALWRRTFVDEMDDPLFLKFYEWAGAEKPAGIYAIINDPQFAVVGRHYDGGEA